MSRRFKLKRARLIERLNAGGHVRSNRLERYDLLDYVPAKQTPPAPAAAEKPAPEPVVETPKPAPEPVAETPKPAPKKAASAPKRKPAAKKAAPKKAAPKAEKSEE